MVKTSYRLTPGGRGAIPKQQKELKLDAVCRQLDIQPYVLRYWETEFPALTRDDEQKGARTYSSDEVLVVARIKALLYEEGYTIAGAKKTLESELDGKRLVAPGGASEDEPSSTASVEKDTPAPPLPSSGHDSSEEGQLVVDRERLREGLREALNQSRELKQLLESL